MAEKKKKSTKHAEGRVAYCWRTGEVYFAPVLPEGALMIASCKEGLEAPDDFEYRVRGACRRAYDGRTLLVPGVPEAGDDDQVALAAVYRFREAVTGRLPRSIGGKPWNVEAL